MARMGRRNSTKFVIHKELIILVLIIVAMIVTTICLSIPSAQKKNLDELNNAITVYNSANSTQYDTLGEECVVRQTSLKNLDKEIKADSTASDDNPEYLYILYGSLSNATICQYLSMIDTEARERKVKVVYLYSSEKVDKQQDKENEEFLAELKNDELIFNGISNGNVETNVEKVDLLKTPALYVFKNGKLVFNSVTIESDGSYNWEIIINKAFSLKDKN